MNPTILALTVASTDPTPSALLDEVERLRSTQRVLYVAAHPDDENTRLISYLVRGRRADTAYLSLTRGGGGQNRIGDEQSGALSVIRTEELLAARAVDGGRQFFTRARDFGYSKTSEETLSVWSEGAVLQDTVHVIRRFRPDIIVTRFRPKGQTHGHHLASAVVAHRAFELAADPGYAGGGLAPWQAERILVNVPRWRNEDDKGDFSIDVSGYTPLLGLTFPELAARARSLHRSQAFGSAPRRGPQREYFEHVDGVAASSDLLEGVPFGWSRYPGGEAVDVALTEVVRVWGEGPSVALPKLLAADRAFKTLEPTPRVREARARLAEIVVGITGLFVRAESDAVLTRGSPAKVRFVGVRRGEVPVELAWVGVGPGLGSDISARRALGRTLEQGAPLEVELSAPVPDRGWSTPHWLVEPPLPGVYAAPEAHDPTSPMPPPALAAWFGLRVSGELLVVRRPVEHVWVDPTRGERAVPSVHLPDILVVQQPKVAWAKGEVTLDFVLESRSRGARTRLTLDVPSGWRVRPGYVDLVLAPSGRASFRVRPPEGAAPADVTLTANGRDLFAETIIDYPHIQRTRVARPARVRVAPIQNERVRARVLYVMGSGDEIPAALRELGVSVEVAPPGALDEVDLGSFDTVVLGVRAYNVRDDLARVQPRLFEWVERGGRLVVQYNTNSWYSKLSTPLAPFPLEVDRTRVTDERAAVELLEPQHPLLQEPHAINAADFDGWVQERGLYFAADWGDQWTPLLSMADPDEPLTQGSLLFARHGRGTVVFTALSFFRQLPAGVPGAARLFLNIVHARRTAEAEG